MTSAMSVIRDPQVRVGIAGLGEVGRELARHIVDRLPPYRLTAVSARRQDRARKFLNTLAYHDAEVVPVGDLADHSDLVIECASPDIFRSVAQPVLRQGKTLIVLSCGALLAAWDLVQMAERQGGQLLIPTGALLGLDAVQGVAQGVVHSVRMTTRKPVRSLQGAPILDARGIDLTGITEPVLLFKGTAREAIAGFPVNLNVAVALALAGLGPDRTMIEVWADPDLDRNTHYIEVDSDSARLEMFISNVPTDNPRTGRLTALSVAALLTKLASPLRVGT